MKIQEHFIKCIDDVLESLPHGQKLTKFIAKDEGQDFSVEIHGFITEDGNFIIVSERFEYKDENT